METTTERRSAEDQQNARLTLIAGIALVVGTIVFLAVAPGTYAILLALHIVAAVIWVGGAVALAILALVAERTKDDAGMLAVGKQAEWLGMRVFTPAAFVVLGLGIALVEKGNWGWSNFWVLAALIGWGLSAAIGIVFLSPEAKRLNALAAQHGLDHPETKARLKRILTIARFDVALLVLIVVDMAAKPFF
jgi:uncharacterized membrane protein